MRNGTGTASRLSHSQQRVSFHIFPRVLHHLICPFALCRVLLHAVAQNLVGGSMLRTSQQRSPGAVACRQGVATRVRTRANQFDRWAQRRRARTHTFGQRRRAAQAPAPPAVSSTLGTPLAAPFSKAVLAPLPAHQRAAVRARRAATPGQAAWALSAPAAGGTGHGHSFAACTVAAARVGRAGAQLSSAPALRVWLVATAALTRPSSPVISASAPVARPAPHRRGQRRPARSDHGRNAGSFDGISRF